MSYAFWETLKCESDSIAENLSEQKVITKENWLVYQKTAYQLLNRFRHLSQKDPSIHNPDIKRLQDQCYSSIQTIFVRIAFFDPEKTSDMISQDYNTQIKELHLKIIQLKDALKTNTKIHGSDKPVSEIRIITTKIEVLRARIEDIRRKQEALY